MVGPPQGRAQPVLLNVQRAMHRVTANGLPWKAVAVYGLDLASLHEPVERTPASHSLRTTFRPQLPSRPPSTHTPWSGRGSWRPGGARHCTNDLDAMGRVCSALAWDDGGRDGSLRARPYERAAASGALSIPVPADPPPGCLYVDALCSDHLMVTSLTRVRRASAQPARSVPKAGAQGGAQPGLEPVEKVVTRLAGKVVVVSRLMLDVWLARSAWAVHAHPSSDTGGR
jgi:hypothetical protein